MHFKIKNVNFKNQVSWFQRLLTQNNTKSKRISKPIIQNKESLDSKLVSLCLCFVHGTFRRCLSILCTVTGKYSEELLRRSLHSLLFMSSLLRFSVTCTYSMLFSIVILLLLLLSLSSSH